MAMVLKIRITFYSILFYSIEGRPTFGSRTVQGGFRDLSKLVRLSITAIFGAKLS